MKVFFSVVVLVFVTLFSGCPKRPVVQNETKIEEPKETNGEESKRPDPFDTTGLPKRTTHEN